jgi:hypothetical protein
LSSVEEGRREEEHGYREGDTGMQPVVDADVGETVDDPGRDQIQVDFFMDAAPE